MCTRLVLAQRKRQDHADHEQEERKDEVVEAKALPRHMLELLGEFLTCRCAPLLADRPREIVAADDPEHIKTTQCIDREQAFGARGDNRRRRWALRISHGSSEFLGACWRVGVARPSIDLNSASPRSEGRNDVLGVEPRDRSLTGFGRGRPWLKLNSAHIKASSG